MYPKTFICSLPGDLRIFVMKVAYYLQAIIWYLTNKPIPTPHLIKIKTILKYAKSYKISNFIETGTYFGETVDATKKYFNQVYSIELKKELYQITKKMFSKDKNIKIIHGDSAVILPKLIKHIEKPSLFWLDAHYSSGITAKGTAVTPILKELDAISKSKIKNHLILIDDARVFTGSGDCPTIKKIKGFVAKKFTNCKITIKDDIIRVYPV